jgi:tetratricopeptide (TPR) repeat protein
MGNYHPITMFIYGIEYSNFELNPTPYHVVSLLMHVLNTLLVMWFVWLLLKQKNTAIITALLFAIHPMHVESVAWVAELKDVMYTFFLLAALCTYLMYIKSIKKKQLFYLATIILFVLATLSKAMAVCLPPLLILIDYFINRKIDKKSIIEKLPFFIIAVIFGLVAIDAQKAFNALDDIVYYNFFDRILFSSYGVLLYLWKAFVPTGLTCYYNYPIKENGIFPIVFYISPVIFSIAVFTLYKYKEIAKDLIFGLGFFIISIALVLQILPVGGAIIAERYTYIPYIGVFLIIAQFINKVYNDELPKIKSYRKIILWAFVLLIGIYSVTAQKRTMVWKDSVTLWSNALEKNNKSPRNISHRAKAYYKLEDYTKAIEDYNWYIHLKNDNAEAYYDRGLCYFGLKKFNEAIVDFNKAIEINNKYYDAYYNKGIVYNDVGDFNKAITAYTNAIKHKPDFIDAYYNRAGAYFMNKQYSLALEDALKAQKLGFNVEPGFINAIKNGIVSAP